MPVKKSAAAKKRTSAKRGPGRPKGSKNKTPAKKTAAKRGPGRPKGSKNVKEVQKPKSKRGGFHREINEETGFVVDTDQDVIAQYLLEGGESRTEIAERLSEVLDTETRNGTEKQIVGMVSSVANKMVANGFTIESSFRVVPPTPASRRAATRAANSTAKKTTSKRGPGRPKGSKNKKK